MKKKLFFGFETIAPWPSLKEPKARLIKKEMRHLTIAFLGEVSLEEVMHSLETLPLPPFRISPVAHFDRCLFLPEKHPRVVAYHPTFFRGDLRVEEYAKKLTGFLKGCGYSFPDRPFLSHVTLGRAPFVKGEWEEKFSPLPCYFNALYLYESLGCSDYKVMWSHPFHPPFEEIEHVADVAFRVYGESLDEIDLHAQVALTFISPNLLPFLDERGGKPSLEEVIMGLNRIVTKGDVEIGTPFKAVSFHGNLEKTKEGLLKWEMIIDV